jgi:hypothetical protein
VGMYSTGDDAITNLDNNFDLIAADSVFLKAS